MSPNHVAEKSDAHHAINNGFMTTVTVTTYLPDRENTEV